jgi:hypothetical protein
MRPALIQLKEQLTNETVFIIGGGSSLIGFDYEKLKGKLSIGINQACVYLPNLTAIYWADEDWAARNNDTLDAHSCKLRFCGRKNLSETVIANDIKALGGATPLRITGDFGIDDNINNVRGNNSGSHVINLCINANAATIVLLGFDMKPKHWHNDYIFHYDNSIYDGFMKSIESIAAACPTTKIINCSMESHITCFPKVPFDEL